MAAIADHAVIGDRRTCALVATDATIDFLCWPRFDSPSVFAALLDPARGGHWRIAPRNAERTRCRQRYLPDTNVVVTAWFGDGAVGEVLDFMPTSAADRRGVVRCVRSVRGALDFDVEVRPAFGYASAPHRVIREDERCVRFETDGLALRLRADAPLAIEGPAARGVMRLGDGERGWLVLERAAPGEPPAWPDRASLEGALDETCAYWRRWMQRSTYRGRWKDEVARSALLLKLLQHADYGSIIAAPTFALPESVGGTRNWDYRFTWIRDAAFALHALSLLGLEEEQIAFLDWLTHRCEHPTGGDGSPLRVLYRVDGSARTPEQTVTTLDGYAGSRPVRIGNAAADQLQLDIFGELFETVALFDRPGEPMHWASWDLLTECAAWVARSWRSPDDGIWESRGVRRPRLLSRVMCWTALDRAIRLGVRTSMPALERTWHDQRDAILADVRASFWDEARGAFVDTPGFPAIDASSLLMPRVAIISPTDVHWRRHVEALSRTLVHGAVVRRYPMATRQDGIGSPEGSFSACAFWLIECLARAGDVARARTHLDEMLGYANHVGLYAEQLGADLQQLGNFPQVLTHLGLISAAVTLDAAIDRAEARR
jgi:GH15 family glucan-1,4-alpha-glucosidase